MNKIKSVLRRGSLITMGVISGIAMLPSKVFAQAAWEPTEQPVQSDLNELIRDGLNLAIIFAAIVAVFYLIYSGFRYMSASGDTQKTEDAQKGIANALIGLIICAVAAIVVNFALAQLGMTTQSL